MNISGRNLDRLVVAMSGGVDSSVVAHLCAEAGHDLVGLFMRNGVTPAPEDAPKKACCSLSDARDARMVAAELEVPFHAVDLAPEFGSIIEYFTAEYTKGRTPNPCAVCNRDLKFDRLLQFARELGFEGVATGHYARLTMRDGRVQLRRGLDPRKDQSYQLFCVDEANLACTVLPLGDLQKDEVRRLARERGIRTAEKRDSQEICFVPSNDYRELLRRRGVELHPGKLVDTHGRQLGEHGGTELFTIGQRKGHGIGGGTPLYVVDLLPGEGVVVLGTRDECRATSMVIEDLNWIGFDPPAAFESRVQHRYHGPAEACRVTLLDGDGEDEAAGGAPRRAHVEFVEPAFSVTPGQGAAFFDGERLLGGGWIAQTVRQGSEPLEVSRS